MLIYLIIGLVVQVLITLNRVFVLKIANFDGFGKKEYFMFISICAINIVIWPISLILEIVFLGILKEV